MLEVMYELREHRKLDEVASPEEIAYLKKLENDKGPEEQMKSKVVEIYKTKDEMESGESKDVVFSDEELKYGQEYATYVQAKIKDYSIAALGSLMETLSITEDNTIKVLLPSLRPGTKSDSLTKTQEKSTSRIYCFMIKTPKVSSKAKTEGSITRISKNQRSSTNS
jgi:tRNA(Met) C34 N-acetyltransferase TmcA